MNQANRVAHLLDFFLQENPQHQNIAIPADLAEQKQLLRALVNLRPPYPVPDEILALEDEYLQEELSGNVVSLSQLTPVEKNIYLWQGDITTLGVDGIVNAGNSNLLGCFHPCHGCIDNIIHTKSGVRLRLACQELMEAQGHPEATGTAKITPAYNLPSAYVLHTVGPIVHGKLQESHKTQLKNCYRAVLDLALEHQLQSVAFCCISTGEFHFPQEEACHIAVDTVRDFLSQSPREIQVIFNVFKEKDRELYEKKLS